MVMCDHCFLVCPGTTILAMISAEVSGLLSKRNQEKEKNDCLSEENQDLRAKRKRQNITTSHLKPVGVCNCMKMCFCCSSLFTLWSLFNLFLDLGHLTRRYQKSNRFTVECRVCSWDWVSVQERVKNNVTSLLEKSCPFVGMIKDD